MDDIDEFERFVEDYTSKLDDILNGKVDDNDRAWAQVQIDTLQNRGVTPAPPEKRPSTPRPQETRAPPAKSLTGPVRLPKLQLSQSTLPEPERTAPPTANEPKPCVGIDYSKWDKLTDAEDEPPAYRDAPATAKKPMPAGKDVRAPAAPRTWSEKARAAAESFREQGNMHFKRGEMLEAVSAYTRAIDALADPTTVLGPLPEKIPSAHDDPLEALDRLFPEQPRGDARLHTNRALALIKLEEWVSAIEDCNAAIELEHDVAQSRWVVKALWRRAEALRGLGKYDEAREDAWVVREIVEEWECADATMRRTMVNPGIALEDVERTLEGIARDHADSEAEQALVDGLHEDESVEFISQVVDELVSEIRDHGGRIGFGEERIATDSLLLRASVLVKLLQTQPEISDVFRITGSFAHLVSRDAMTPHSVRLVLPVLLEACRFSTANRREMVRHVEPVVTTLLATVRPDTELVEAAAELLDVCAVDPTFANALRRTKSGGPALGGLILAHLRGPNAGVASTPRIVEKLLSLLVRILDSERTGTDHGRRMLLDDWGIATDALVAAAGVHIGSDHAGVVRASCACLHWLARSTHPRASHAIDAHFDSSADALLSSLERLGPSRGKAPAASPLARDHRDEDDDDEVSNSPYPDLRYDLAEMALILLGTLHNMLPRLEHPITAVLERHNVVPRLVRLMRDAPRVRFIAVGTLAKLLKLHSGLVITALDGWWDDIPMRELLVGDDERERRSALQILSTWLVHDGGRHVAEWRAEGGFEVLVDVLRRLAGPASNEEDAVGREREIGNLALCLSECARKEDHAQTLVESNTVEPLVLLLRAATLVDEQKNLAIACARLCQIPTAREQVRELKGLELMYSLGSKIIA
ncbi:hypothetical protein BDK51DRAFT_38017 [Blyttiomyces helicus]|uniref:Protein unc-45 homolog B n=1 Tax=Blyttiomyces helicus TaxID=388810 RepID=A0A4P9WQ92_9FUNG|nr:hypothetical protein BDK51DRAFT_38017 [Blyttiomyces helicus]|eukprot:RKO93380.1 hypothetical protein BDK51DRAFT_38017 [Blyttiomyces helicus]